MSQSSKSALVEQLSHLTVLQVVELVQTLETQWGVSAQPSAPSTHIIQPIGPPEPTTVDLVLTDYGPNKIKVIKEVRSVMMLGLKEAKGYVDQVPVVLQKDMDLIDAKELQQKLEAVGASVTLEPHPSN